MNNAPQFSISLNRRPGTLYKLLPGSGVAVDNIVPLTVDVARMAVPAVICTPAVDREKEVIIPEGVQFGNYARNPVVLWEHGFAPEIPLPIAKSETPDKRLTISRPHAGQIDAVAYFTDKDPISNQIFGLIEAGIVRATSIHVIPAPGMTQRKYVGNEQVTIYPQSDLLEWSFGCLGVNPESVAKVMDLGRIGGDVLCESVRKTLTPWMPVRRVQGVGADFGGVAKCAGPCTGETKCAACSKEESDMAKSVAKAIPPGLKKEDEEDPTKAKAMTAPPGAAANPDDPPVPDDEPVPSDEPPPEEEAPTDDGMKPSARVLGAVHESLVSLVANIEGASNQYENPDAIEFLADLIEQLKTHATETEALLGQISGGDEAPDVAEPEEASEEVVKTWLATAPARGARLQLAGLGNQVERLVKSIATKPADRAAGLTLAKSIRAIAHRAAADAKAGAANREKELEAKLDRLTEQYLALQTELQEVA